MRNLQKLAIAFLLLVALGVPALADGGITASDSWLRSSNDAAQASSFADGGITANDSWLTSAVTAVVTVVNTLP
jgi:hypothetical protein